MKHTQEATMDELAAVLGSDAALWFGAALTAMTAGAMTAGGIRRVVMKDAELTALVNSLKGIRMSIDDENSEVIVELMEKDA